MIKLYNKKIYFEHDKLLNLFILTVNKRFFRLSYHAKKRILQRFNTDIQNIGYILRDYKIKYDDIIEYTFNNGTIQKVLIRIPFNFQKDLMFSIADDGTIITIYLNNKADKHYTLNKRQYQTLTKA
ncbi:MAG: hypothetical protein ACTSWG_10600 [Candidatus Helarchaeota archaeon]